VPKPGDLDKKTRFFTRIFRSYLLILVIPFLISLILTQISSSILESEAKKSNQATLEQTRDIVDSRIQELDSLVKQLAIDPKIKAFLGMRSFEDSDHGYYDLWSLTRSLPNFSLTNTFINKFFIYSNKMEVAVSFEEALTNSPRDYARVFHYGEWNYKAWNDFFLQSYHRKAFVPQAEIHIGTRMERGFYYLQSLPLEIAQAPPLGLVMFFIDEGAITNYLRRLDSGSNGVVMVVDAQGKIISAITQSWAAERMAELALLISRGEGLSRPGYIVSKAVSSSIGWTYVSVLPEKLVLSPVLLVRNIVLVLFLVSIAASLVVAWILAGLSARPIESAFKGLEGQREALREEIERQQPLVRADLMRRILSGLAFDPSEIAVLAGAAGMDLEGSAMAAGLIHIEGYGDMLLPSSLGEINFIKAFIRERLRGSGEFVFYVQDEDVAALSLVVLSKSLACMKFGPMAAKAIEDLRLAVAEELHSTVKVSLGEPVSTAERLVLSYREARDRLAGPDELAERKGEGALFSYPLETEMRLASALKKGQLAEVQEILAQVRKENLDLRSLSPAMFSALAGALFATVLRALPPGLAGAAVPDGGHADQGGWFDRFSLQAARFCQDMEDSRSSGVRAKLGAINQYLQDNLADPGLTLYAAAVRFSMSETFFYHFYRDNAGLSFADQLEKLRIEKACKLLAEERAQVKDVIARTGFATASTFRRAFKRVIGIAPSDYKPSQ